MNEKEQNQIQDNEQNQSLEKESKLKKIWEKIKKVLIKIRDFCIKIKDKIVEYFSSRKKPTNIDTIITNSDLKFSLEKIVNSSQNFKSEDIIKVISKEKIDYLKALNTIYSSKYAKDYEVLGYLLSNLNEETISERLDEDEKVIVYMYAILYAEKVKSKEKVKMYYEKVKEYSDNKLYSFVKLTKKMSFDEETSTVENIKKFAKEYEKYFKNIEELSQIELSLTKYLYRTLGHAKVKLLNKIHQENESKYNNLQKEDLLCLKNYLVKGYIHAHMFKQANEIIIDILQSDKENYSAEEAKMFIEAKCTTIGEFINKRDINENESFANLQTKANETKNDTYLYGISNIIEEFTIQKKEQKETRMRNIRELVAGGTCGFAVILLIIGMLLDSTVFNVLIIIFMIIHMLSTLIRYDLITYIKNNTKDFIISTVIKVVTGTVIIILAFVLPNVIKSIIDSLF